MPLVDSAQWAAERILAEPASNQLIANGKVTKQKTENGTELVLKTDNGDTDPNSMTMSIASD